MTALWIAAMVLALGGGVCAAQTSCYREQGDTEKARTLSMRAVLLLVLAILCGIVAWVW